MIDPVRHTFDLTVALWRVTDRLPESEPLRTILRDKAYGILHLLMHGELGSPESIPATVNSLRLGIRNLDADLFKAQGLDLIKRVNFQVLRREYGFLRTTLGREKVGFGRQIPPQPIGLNGRQGQILNYLQGHGPATLPEILQLFPGDLSVRTIQRDLASLIETNALRRLSHKRWARYAFSGATRTNVV